MQAGSFGSTLADDVNKGAGPSTSTSTIASTSSSGQSQTEKPKANDISHLIKRKKPDTSTEASTSTDASPAKKPAL